MKKFSFLLLIVLVISLCGCSSNGQQANNNSSVEKNEESSEKTAIEQLNEKEKLLFDALCKITKSDFFEPSAIRVLEIGDYRERTRWGKDSVLYGPDTIVVRLQGENRVGGTLNHYYLVCIKDGESQTSQDLVKSLKQLEALRGGYMESILQYSGTVGDYTELSDSYKLEEDLSNSASWNIGKINKALAEYWENLGF